MTLKIDIDFNEDNTWNIKYKILKTLPYKDAQYYLTKHGIHIIIPSLPNDFNLRHYFGDDIRRIILDIQRQKYNLHNNVLFDFKNGHYAEETTIWEAIKNVRRA
jgi:tRNA(Ile)-lysidine synthase TilS/MesJ